MEIDFVLENLKKRRLTLGMTQKDIASKLSMDERAYSKIERGVKKSMNINMVFSLVEVLETTLVDLLQQPEGAAITSNTCQSHMLKKIIDTLRQISEQQAHLVRELGNIREQLS